MKVTILILLCVCIIFVPSEAKKRSKIEKMTDEVIKKLNSAPDVNRPQLFKNTDLVGLLKVCEKGKIFTRLAVDAFQRNYGSKIISLLSMTTINVHETGERIEAENLVSSMFNVFGGYIEKLELNYNELQDGDQNEIHKLIGKYCSKSLMSLSLLRWDTKILQSLDPFTKLDNLTLTGNKQVIKGYFSFDFLFTKKKLNEIFPALRRLAVDYVLEEGSIFDVEFSQLEQVKISSPWPLDDYANNTKLSLKSLFTKNPQITHLIYVHCNSLEMLKIASDYLPNLGTLQVNIFRLDDENTGEKIHFTAVKKAFLWWDETKLSRFLSFDQLEELYMTCSADECVDFIEQNKNVRKIFIAGNSLKDQHILEIGEEIKNLEELFIATTADIDTTSIKEYYKINEKLKKFRLEVIDSQFLYSKMEHEIPDKHFE